MFRFLLKCLEIYSSCACATQDPALVFFFSEMSTLTVTDNISFRCSSFLPLNCYDILRTSFSICVKKKSKKYLRNVESLVPKRSIPLAMQQGAPVLSAP
jgi:hypothetical protein